MTHEDFIKLIGQDLVVDYLFGDELQQWNMKNFYVDNEGKVHHKHLPLITDIFITRARNPHKGKATHG